MAIVYGFISFGGLTLRMPEKKQKGNEIAVGDIIIVLREEEMLRNMRICLPINFKQEKKKKKRDCS